MAETRLENIAWPPTRWDESKHYRDKETRLPTRLFPFHIAEDKGTWSVFVERKNGKEAQLESNLPNIFSAFRKMLWHYERWFPGRPREQVYFIGYELAVGQPIKVGFSLHPEARLRSLQTSSPNPLQIFATIDGGKDLEGKYHKRWKHRRLNGEWFVIGDCIINEIARIKKTKPQRPSGKDE